MNYYYKYVCFLQIISEESAKNLTEEKKQREQLLALNQVIAQQVMEKRKSLPGKYLCK